MGLDVLQLRARVTEPQIEALVQRFYTAVLADELLAPVFAARIAPDNWPAHLTRMVEFWSTVLRGTGRYRGNPIAPHLPLREVRAAHLERWLALFEGTTAGIFDADVAAAITARAHGMGDKLREAMAL